MKYNKEDITKIKQLIKSDDIDNVHIGISLAIYTLGMSVDELIGLIDESDIIVKDDELVNNGYWRHTLYCFTHTFFTDQTVNVIMERYKRSDVKGTIELLIKQ